MSELSVSWLGRRVKRGDILSTATSAREPIIEYRSPDKSYATLVVTDLDAPYPERPEKSPLLHWLVVNIRSPGISTGEILADYLGPNPPSDSSQHRYLFEVYQQDKRIDANPITERNNFNIQKFARDHDVELELKADNQIRVGASTIDFPGKTSTVTTASEAKPAYIGGGHHYHEDGWYDVDRQVHSKPAYRGGRRYIVETDEPIPEFEDQVTEIIEETSPKVLYPPEVVEVRRMVYTGGCGCGKKTNYTGGKPRSKSDYTGGRASRNPAAFCRGSLHVEAKDDPTCEAENWPRGEGCYNPYKVSAKSTGTSVGRGGSCAPYINPEDLDDADLAAYVRLTNHKLRQMKLPLIGTDLSREETLVDLHQKKAQLLKKEGR